MFQEKIRKGIAGLLIVCMTICSNGFATLAESAKEGLVATEQTGSQENTTNYYYEYQQELALNAGKSHDSLDSFGDSGDFANADNSGDNEKENIVLDGEKEQTTTVPKSQNNDEDGDSDSEAEDIVSDSSFTNDSGYELSPDSFGTDSEKKSDYPEEPEEEGISNEDSDYEHTEGSNEDNENNENIENTETTKEASSAQDDSNNDESTTETVASSEGESTTEVSTETTDKESSATTNVENTTETTTIEETEPTTETSTEETTTIIDTTTSTEKVTEATESEPSNIEKEVKVVKRYIKATNNDADVFNDGRKHNFKVKEILLDSQDGSIDRAMSFEEIEEKYLAKTIKVLLVDQYGNEKILRVDAKWNHEYYDLSDEHHMEVKEEKEQERIEEKKTEKEVVFDENDLEELKESLAETKDEAEAKVEEPTDEQEAIDSNDIEDTETVAAFNGTNKDDNEDNLYETSDDSSQVSIGEDDDIEVVYEDIIVFGDSENTDKEQALTDDATSGSINESNAQSVTVNKLDEQALIDSLAQQLNELGGDFTIIIDKDDIDELDVNIFGATKNHGTHAVCGMTTCDRHHYRYDPEHQGTYDVASQVLSELHPRTAYNDLPSGATAVYFANGGDWALQNGSLTVDKEYHINGSLRLCLSGNNLNFAAAGKLVIDSPSGSLIICNCKPNQKAYIQGVTSTTYRTAAANSAIEINSIGDCEIYGLRGLTNNNIVIQNLLNINSGVANNTFANLTAQGRTAGFIHVGRYEAGTTANPVISEPSGRLVAVCDIDVDHCHGLVGGFMWAEYVNSFVSCDVNIEGCSAARGAAYAIDYYQNALSQAGNDYMLFLGNTITDCSNVLNSAILDNHENYSDMYHSEDANGIVLLNNYSSVQDVIYRQIRGNVISNNTLRANISAIHINSNAEKSTNFFGNTITANHDSIPCYLDQLDYVDKNKKDLANAAAGVTFSSSDITSKKGNINFSGNTIANNTRYISDEKAGAGGVAFINVGTVNLNDQLDLEQDTSRAKPCISNNFSTNRGAGALFESVEALYARTTEFKNNGTFIIDELFTRSLNQMDANDRSDVSKCFGGAAMFLYDVETAHIGYNGYKNDRNIMEFIDNTSSYVGGAIAAYGTNVENSNQQMQLWEGRYEGNIAGWHTNIIMYDSETVWQVKIGDIKCDEANNQYSRGGSLYTNGVYAVSLHGSNFKKNLAYKGASVYIQKAKSFLTSLYALSTEVTKIEDSGKASDFNGIEWTRFMGLDSSIVVPAITCAKDCDTGAGMALVDVGNAVPNDIDVDLQHLDIEGNTAKKGSALYICDNRKVSGGISVTYDNVNISLTTIIGNKVTNNDVDNYDGGAIYNDGYDLLLAEKTDIKQNQNAIWLGDSGTITLKYNRTQRGTSEAMEADAGKAIITQNTGNYVIGFKEYGAGSVNRVIKLYGGAIYENELNAMAGVTNWNVNTTRTGSLRVGIFEARQNNSSNKTTIMLGGAIEVYKNKRVGSEVDATHPIYQDIPLEQSATTANRRFNIYVGRDNGATKLYHNCIIGITAFDLTYDSNGRANEYRLFNNGSTPQDFTFTEDWIEGVSEHGVPSEMFINNRENDTNDGRKIYADLNSRGQISLVHGDNLIGFNFEMLNHESDMEAFSTQYIRRTGGTLFRPAAPNALSTDGALRYNTTQTVRAFDIMGFRGYGNDQRFAPWDFGETTKPDDLPPSQEPTRLHVIYQLLNHKHKVCGNTGDVCDHINHDESHTVFFGDPDFQFESQSAVECRSIEVGHPAQLFYAKFHPEYMYVLTNDIVIDSTIWGRDTNGILNDPDHPIEGLKLCLNGYSLTMASDNNISLLSLSGDSYICNCALRDNELGAPKHAALGYENANQNRINNFDTAISVSTTTPSQLNFYGHSYRGEEANSDGYINFKNIILSGQRFISTKARDSLVMDYVKLQGAHLTYGCDFAYSKNSTYVSNSIFRENHIGNYARIFYILDEADLGHESDISFQGNTFEVNDSQSDSNGLIRIITLNQNSMAEFIENTFIDNNMKDKYGCINISGEGRIRMTNLTFTKNVFTNNTGGAIYTVGLQAGQFNFTENEFRNNSLVHSSNRTYGSAIAISNVGQQATTYNLGAITFNSDIFEGNTTAAITDGKGTVYFNNTQAVRMTEVSFKENIAAYGSAVYDLIDNTQAMPLGNRTYEEASFNDNGNSSSMGTYYIAHKPTANTEIRTVFSGDKFEMKNNIGAVSGFYVEEFNTGAGLIFDAQTITFKDNGARTTGASGEGAVMKFNLKNTAGGGYVRFAPESKMEMINNKVGTALGAIELDDTNNQNGIVNFEISGKIKIIDNLNSSNKKANFHVNKSLALTNVEGNKLDVDKVAGVYNSQIGINGTQTVINGYDSKEVNIYVWNNNTINRFGTAGILSDEVFCIDTQETESDLRIYKGDGDYVTLGMKDNCKKLGIYVDVNTQYNAKPYVFVKYDANVYLDYFATAQALASVIPTAISSNFSGASAYTEGSSPYMSTDYTGTAAIWNFTNNKFKASRTDDTQRVNVIWSCKHGHNLTGAAAASLTWIIALDGQMLNISKNAAFVLANDITMSDTITNTHQNYGVCLNGHNIYRNNEKHLLALTGKGAEARQLCTIMNCDSNGALYCVDDRTDSLATATSSLTYLEGSTERTNGQITFINIKFKKANFNPATTDTDRGAIVHSLFGTINFQSCSFFEGENSVMTNEGYVLYLRNSSTNFDVNTNLASALGETNIKNMSFRGRGFMYIDCDNSNLANNSKHYINGKFDMSGNNISMYDDSTAFFDIRYCDTFQINFGGDSQISNNEVVFSAGDPKYRSLFYINDPQNFNILRTNNTATLKIDNNSSDNGVFCFGNNRTISHGKTIVTIGNNVNSGIEITRNSSSRAGSVFNYDAGAVATSIGVDLTVYADKISENANGIDNPNLANGGFLSFTSAEAKTENHSNVKIYAREISKNYATGDGGVAYVEDTNLEIASELITQNGAEVGGAAVSSADIKTAKGGVVYAKSSKVVINSNIYANEVLMTQNYSMASASVIYMESGASANEDKDVLILGDQNGTTEDTIKIATNSSLSDGGSVQVEQYTSVFLYGHIEIFDNGTLSSYEGRGHNNFTALCFNKDLKYDDCGVKRKIGTNFDYDNSKIYASVQYNQNRLFEGWARPSEELKNVFVSDKYTDEDGISMSVYSTGLYPNFNVHIGSNQATIAFYLGKGAQVTRDTGAGPRTYTVGDEGYLEEMIQFAGSGAPIQVKDPESTDGGSWSNFTKQVEREGTTYNCILLGWVAYCYDVNSPETKNQTMKNIDFDEESIYIEDATNNFYVYAVWGVNGTSLSPDMKSCGITQTDACSHQHHHGNVSEFDHPAVAQWVIVDRYEQLFFPGKLGTNEYAHALIADVVDEDANGKALKSSILAQYIVTGGGATLNRNNSYDIELKHAHGFAYKHQYQKDFTSPAETISGEKLLISDYHIQRPDTTDVPENIGIKYTGTEKLHTSLIDVDKFEMYGFESEIYGESPLNIQGFEFDVDSTGKATASLIKTNILNLEHTNIHDNINGQIQANVNMTYMYGAEITNNTMPEYKDGFTKKETSLIYLDQPDTLATVTPKIVYTSISNNQASDIITFETGTIVQTTMTFALEGTVIDNNTNPVEGSGNIVSAIMSSGKSMGSYEAQYPIINFKGYTRASSSISNNIGYANAFDIQHTSLALEETKVLGNHTFDHLIHIYSNNKNITMKTIDAEIKNNVNAADSDEFKVLFFEGRENGSGLTMRDTYITDNVNYGEAVELYCIETGKANRPLYLQLEKTVQIYDNMRAGDQRNLFMQDYIDSYSGNKLVRYNNAYPVSSASKIGVTITNMDTIEETAYISYQTWTNNGVASVKGVGATHNIFKSDNPIYKVYRTGTNIIIGKQDIETVTVKYEYYCDIVSTPLEYQNIVADTHADHPGIPIAEDGAKFIAWYFDEDLTVPYVWQDNDTTCVIKGEGTPKIATLYALWDRIVELKVHKNDNEDDRDIVGDPYGHIVHRYEGGYNSVPANVKYSLPMGKTIARAIMDNSLEIKFYTDDAFTIEDTSIGNNYNYERIEYVREDTIVSEDGWWSKNGWNAGKNNGNWGEEFKYNDDKKGVVKKSMDLYTGWKSAPVYVVFDLNVGASSTVDDAVLSTTSAVFYYRSVVREGQLAEASMPGYKFNGWYTSATVQDDSNRLSVGTPCFIKDAPETNPATLYAGWVPVNYTVELIPWLRSESPTSIYPKVDPFRATYTQIATFDHVINIMDNPYTRIGKKAKSWTYYNMSGVPVEVMLEEESNAVIDECLTATENEIVQIYLDWDNIKYEVTFNPNDGINGTFIGTTPADNESESFEIEYGQVINTCGSIPAVVREGYLFDGWWTEPTCTEHKVELTATYSYPGAVVDVTGKEGYDIKVASNSTLYAKWKNNIYNIFFDKNTLDFDRIEVKGTMSDANILKAEFDKPVTIPINVFVADGFTYNGLYNDETSLAINNSTQSVTTSTDSNPYNYNLGTPKGDGIATGSTIALLAQWTEHRYDLIYHINTPSKATKPELIGSTKEVKETYDYSQDVTIINGEDTFSIYGYKFLYFTDNPDGTGDRYTVDTATYALAGRTPNKDGENQTKHLYARWVRSPYTIKYSGGTLDTTLSAITGSLNDQLMTVGADVQALFNHKGGSYTYKDPETDEMITIDSGEGFKAPGYHFDHWYDREDDTKTYVENASVSDLRTEAESEVGLEAVWAPNTYTLKFSYATPTTAAIGTSNVITGKPYYETLSNDEKKILFDEEYTLEPTLYFEDEDFEQYVKVNGYKVDYIEDKDGVRYNADNNAFLAKAGTLSDADDVYELTYHFAPRTYSLEYNLNDEDGDTPADEFTTDVNVVYDGHFNTASPSRFGYKFVGWTLDKKYSVDEDPDPQYLITPSAILRKYQVDPNTGYVGTLYAKWAPGVYKLKLNANTKTGAKGLAQAGYYKVASGSEIVPKQFITKDVKYEKPVATLNEATPTLAGYHFNGKFYTDEAGTEDEVTYDTLMWAADDNQVIYAQYDPNSYKVVFLASDSEVENPTWGTESQLTLSYDQDPAILPAIVETDASTTFKLKGFTFVGWEHINRVLSPTNSNTYNTQYYDNLAEVVNLSENEGSTAYLRAMWRENTYDIFFDANAPASPVPTEYNTPVAIDPTADTSMTNVLYRSTISMPDTYWTITGYEFKGWNTKADGTGIFYASASRVSRLASNVYGDGGVITDREITLYAQWEAKIYDLALDLNDVFATHQYAGTSTASFVKPDQSIKVKLKYDTFYKDAYVTVGDATISQSLSRDSLEVIASRSGYTFLGWSKTAAIPYSQREVNLITDTDYFRGDNIATVYATWKNNTYTLQFNATTIVWDVDTPPDQEIIFDANFGEDTDYGKVSNLPQPTHPSYTFYDWFLGTWDFVDPTIYPYSEGNKVVKNDTKFDASCLNYITPDGTVTVNAYWGGEKVTVTIDPGYEEGAKVDTGALNKGIRSGVMVSTLSFAAMYGSSLNYIEPNLHLWTADQVAITGVVKKKGHKFIQWYSEGLGYDANGEWMQVKDDTIYWYVSENATISALWEPNIYKVKYHFQLPENVSNEPDTTTEDGAEQEVMYGDTVSPQYFAEMSLAGWNFLGWYTKATYNEAVDATSKHKWFTGDKATQSEWVWDLDPAEFYDDITKDTFDVYAIWEAKQFTVTWDLNQGPASSVATLSGGRKATMSILFDDLFSDHGGVPIATRAGYDFDGFYSTLGNWVGSDQWMAVDVKNDTDYNNSWEDVVHSDDQYTTRLVNGEYKAVDATYYAKWTPKQYTIILDGNKPGSSSDAWRPTVNGQQDKTTRKIMFDDTISKERERFSIYDEGKPFAAPTEDIPGELYSNATFMKGYEFVEWNTKADGTGETVELSMRHTTTSDVTYYAQWTPNQYTINFDANDGVAPNHGGGSTTAVVSETSKTLYYDEAIGTLPTVERDGYEFLGWYTKNPWADGGDQIFAAASQDAQWGTKLTPTTLFNLDLDGMKNHNPLNDEDASVDNTPRNITVYARYRRREYSIKYYAQTSEAGNGSTLGEITVDGAGIGTTSYTISPVFFDLNIMVRDQDTLARRQSNFLPYAKRIGYTFVTWSTDHIVDPSAYVEGHTVNANTIYTGPSATGSSLEVYGLWRAETWTITYLNNLYDELTIKNGSHGVVLPHSAAAGEMDDVRKTDWDFTVQFDHAMENLIPEGDPNEPIYYSNKSGDRRKGYDFKGWRSKIGKLQGQEVLRDTVLNKELLNNSDSYNTTSKTLSIYAQWEQHTYTVNFEHNFPGEIPAGSKDTMDPLVDVNFNELRQIATSPEAVFNVPGYQLVGLDETALGVIQYPTDPRPRYPLEADGTIPSEVYRLAADDGGSITLYGAWEARNIPIEYRNATESTGNRVRWDKTVNQSLPYWYTIFGATDRGITSIPSVDDDNAPYREDYTFEGWLLPDGSTTSEAKTIEELTDGFTRTEDLILYALWRPNTDGFLLNANNGNGRDIHVPFDTAEDYTFDRPSRFTKDDKQITYFCTDPTGEYGQVFQIGQTVPMSELKRLYDENGEELILFAIWHDGRNRGGQSEKSRSNRSRSGGGSGGGGGGGGADISLNNVQNPNAQMFPQANQITPLASPVADGMGINPTPGNWVYDPVRGVWEYMVTSNNQNTTGLAQSTAGSGGSGSIGGSSGGGGGAASDGESLANGGWYLINTANGNKWYYFDTTSAMKTGPIEVAGKIYYLAVSGNEIGQMQTGAVLINGSYFYFNKDGSLFINGVTPEGLVVNGLGMIIG